MQLLDVLIDKRLADTDRRRIKGRRPFGRVAPRDLVAVQVGNVAIVVIDRQRQPVQICGIVDLKLRS